MTEIGNMLREAMRQKAEELGGPYTFRDLDRDSGVHFTTAQKVAAGKRRPSSAIVAALSRALDPYLPLDEALLAAGHAPASPTLLQRTVDEARRLAGRAVEGLVLSTHHIDVTSEEPAQHDAGQQHRDQDGQEPPP